jgi:hypothetical protein
MAHGNLIANMCWMFISDVVSDEGQLLSCLPFAVTFRSFYDRFRTVIGFNS